jgi:excinuclease ABC subunit A
MQIKYTGVSTNNLKNVDVSLEWNGITLLSGPSGSGKSSLAIDTIHAISEDEL